MSALKVKLFYRQVLLEHLSSVEYSLGPRYLAKKTYKSLYYIFLESFGLFFLSNLTSIV